MHFVLLMFCYGMIRGNRQDDLKQSEQSLDGPGPVREDKIGQDPCCYLAGVKLAFVDNSPSGEGADVEPQPDLGDGVGGNLSQLEHLLLQVSVLHVLLVRYDEHLADQRLGVSGHRAETLVISGRISPHQHFQLQRLGELCKLGSDNKIMTGIVYSLAKSLQTW